MPRTGTLLVLKIKKPAIIDVKASLFRGKGVRYQITTSDGQRYGKYKGRIINIEPLKY
jgi:hypothetical protein